jgi:hypothetical protein
LSGILRRVPLFHIILILHGLLGGIGIIKVSLTKQCDRSNLQVKFALLFAEETAGLARISSPDPSSISPSSHNPKPLHS